MASSSFLPIQCPLEEAEPTSPKVERVLDLEQKDLSESTPRKLKDLEQVLEILWAQVCLSVKGGIFSGTSHFLLELG